MAAAGKGRKRPSKPSKPGKSAPTRGPLGFVLYRSADGAAKLNVRLQAKTVWLTQTQLADLYQTTKQNVSLHVRNILEEGELQANRTVKDYLTVQEEGGRRVERSVAHYSLEMIVAVGYRVRSARGTQFRQWATTTLTEYLAKGFVLDDARLKETKALGIDYFDELLARIRDIRSSERRFYAKITDIYTTSVDYEADAPMTREFFATVQNKLHWAIHGHTAAEVIRRRADADRPNMGLTTWKNAPDGLIRREDVMVAKNYLVESELGEFNRIVTMYLDYAEEQARRHVVMHMADWIAKLDGFLRFNERSVLSNAGTVSSRLAQEHAEGEFERYDTARRLREGAAPTSDFDRFVERTKELGDSATDGTPEEPS